MSSYVITLHGCDDSTSALVDLGADEADALRRVAAAIEARATYGCKPTMLVETYDEASAYRREAATEAIEATS